MLSKKPRPLDHEQLKNYAARLMAGRALTSQELKRKLRARAERASDADEVVASLAELGVVNDERLAESFAESRASAVVMGRRKALTQLRSRGVSSDAAAAAVEQAYGARDERQLVEQYLEKKYRGKNLNEELKDPKKLASVYRRLRTAGFGASASITVLKRHAAQASELEDMPDEPEEAAQY